MLILAARRAFAQIFAPEFRGILLRSLGLTLLLLAAVWAGAFYLLGEVVTLPYAWMETGFAVLTGVGLVIGLGFLIAPVTSLFAGLYLDDVAAAVEAADYPDDPPGREMPLIPSLIRTVKFLGVVVLGNLLALMLLLVPLVNVAAFFLVNGYLLGREYFENVAMRLGSEDAAAALRREHRTTVFFAGLIIAGVVAVPILNLTAPIFATVFMTHVHKALTPAGRRSAEPRPPRT
jgi:CysZ protein